jgi:hypothetical protein
MFEPHFDEETFNSVYLDDEVGWLLLSNDPLHLILNEHGVEGCVSKKSTFRQKENIRACQE